MRFHIPNNEVDKYFEQKEANRKEVEGSGEESSEDETTAAKLFNDRIIKKANIGSFAGALISSI